MNKNYFTTFSLFLLALIGSLSSQAQHHGNQGMPNASGGAGSVYGQVIDSISAQPLEYVTISLIDGQSGSVINGMVTNHKGKYNIENIAYGNYKVKYDFVGYRTKFSPVISITKENPAHGLPIIKLGSSLHLDEVTIDGSKPAISFEIDKKVVNVSDMDTEVSQTAVEVLENIPSISVDLDGNVSLRGNSSFTLLIDGKPSALSVSDALRSIPASTIENIEIITNASAKYEAEGISGLINIITKKKKLQGTSLLLNLSPGNYSNHSGDISLSINKNKWAYNFGGGISLFNRPRTLHSKRISENDSIRTEVISEGEDYFRHGFEHLSGEISFSPNNGHSFTIGAKIGQFQIDNGGEIRFNEFQNNLLTNEYNNHEEANRDFNTYRTFFTYRHNLRRDKKHYVEFTTIYRSRVGDETSITEFRDIHDQLTRATKYTETGPTNFIRFNLDYSKAFSNDSKIELGSQIQYGVSGDDGKNFFYDFDLNDFILDPQFSSQVDYSRDIMAGYGVYKSKINKLGYQLGFRVEQTIRNISSDNFEDFANINRLDYFPSAHLSYQLPKDRQIMLSYSRRINRPRSWYFEPFLTWQTAYQLRQGNPDLLPEYIDALELNWNTPLGKGGNFSIETYYRQVENVINRVNEVYEGNILVTKPYNVGQSTSFGVEPSVNFDATKWWKVSLGVNLYNYEIHGDFNTTIVDQSSFVWNTRMSNTFKLGKDWRFQFSPQYNSNSVTPQGTESGFFRANASIKKSIKQGKYSFGLQGRDVFSTSFREREAQVGNVYLYTYREPRTPFVSFSFSMRLNNYQKKMGRGGMEDDF